MLKQFTYSLVLLFIFTFIVACEQDFSPENQSLPFLKDSINIVINPYNIAPLTASVSFETTINTKVKYQLKNTAETLFSSNQYTSQHQLDIMGLLAGEANQIELILTDKENNFQIVPIEITTPPLPGYLPNIEILQYNENAENGWNMVSMLYAKDNKYWAAPFMYDENGNIRWYFEIGEDLRIGGPYELLKNGNFIVGANHTIYEISRMGQILNTWDIGIYRMHHDIYEMPNGNLLIPTSSPEVLSIFDQLIELDIQTGAIINEWDLRETLDANRQTLGNGQGDWLHINSVWYDENDNTIVLSARSQGIFKMDFNGNLKWIIGTNKGWGLTGLNDTGPDANQFLFTAVDANNNAYNNQIQLGNESDNDFDWPWVQHAAMVNNNGNILAFDNGDYRNYSFNQNNYRYSRAVEYQLNETEQTIKQVWSYGKERGLDYYSAITGDIDILPNTNNRLIASLIIRNSSESNKGYVTEVSYPTNNIVSEAKIEYSNFNSNGSNVWNDFDYSFRAERMKLYP